MRIITLEEHFTTPKLQAATAAHQQGPQNPFVEKVADKLGDLGDLRLADTDAAGIDLQVLSLNVIFVADALAPSEITEICRDANDRAAAAVREPALQRKPSDFLQSNVSITTSGYFTHPPFLCALQVVGADRLLFSVDYPYSQNTDGRAFLDSLPISTADREKIASGNAERLLRLA